MQFRVDRAVHTEHISQLRSQVGLQLLNSSCSTALKSVTIAASEFEIQPY
jgi:hypothetical protein